MSARRRGNKHRPVPPEKIEDPDIPQKEDEIFASSEDNIYKNEERTSSESYADSEEVTSENESMSSEEVEFSPPPAKTTSSQGRQKAAKTSSVKKDVVPFIPVRKPKPKTSTLKPKPRKFKILSDSIKPGPGSPIVVPEDLSANGGCYTGKNPMQAAKKAFTRICRVATDGGECTYIFSVQETTQSSREKIFTYRGIRGELENPHKVTKGGTTYSIRFSSDVISYKSGGVKSKTLTAKSKVKSNSKSKLTKKSPGSGRRNRGKTTSRSSTRGRVRGRRGRV